MGLIKVINIVIPEVLKNPKTIEIGQLYQEAAKFYNIEINFIGRNEIIQTAQDCNLKPSPDGTTNVLFRISPYTKLPSSFYCINRQDKLDYYKSKFNTLVALKDALKTPHTLFCHQLPDQEIVEKNFRFPIVIKPDVGTQGVGVDLVQDYDKLSRSLRDNMHLYDNKILLQEYIETSHGKDLRVISIRGNPVTSMLRENHDGFRANLHQGAKGMKYQITHEMKTICQEVYRTTGLDFCGIDLLFGKEGLIFNEANLYPGMNIMFVTERNILKDVFKLFA